MDSYNDRDEERYGNRRAYDRSEPNRRYRGQRYGGAYESERGWESADPDDPAQYGSPWPEERGQTSHYLTGDAQGRGFAGGRDFGRSQIPFNERESGYGRERERGYSRPYGASGPGPQYAPFSERHYEGTNRPPDY